MTVHYRRSLLLGVVFLFLGWIPISQGLIVTLSAYTSYSLYGPDGVTPLAEGSIVMIIGSLDSTPDPMFPWAGGYVAQSTTGDDVFIGIAYVLDDGTISAGGFKYDSTMVNYLYLRFFDTTLSPIQGTFAWGTTDVWWVTNQFQFVNLDFAPDHGYQVGHTNLFVIIPEADTRNYMMLAMVLGMGWGLYGVKRGKEARVHIKSC